MIPLTGHIRTDRPWLFDTHYCARCRQRLNLLGFEFYYPPEPEFEHYPDRLYCEACYVVRVAVYYPRPKERS